jgi:hypothetical protein
MKTLHLKLIDGNFTAQEAREILLKIYSDKIQFHEMRNFSAQERFGKPDLHSSMRISELQAAKEEIKRELASVDPETFVRINSTIEVHKQDVSAPQSNASVSSN